MVPSVPHSFGLCSDGSVYASGVRYVSKAREGAEPASALSSAQSLTHATVIGVVLDVASGSISRALDGGPFVTVFGKGSKVFPTAEQNRQCQIIRFERPARALLIRSCHFQLNSILLLYGCVSFAVCVCM